MDIPNNPVIPKGLTLMRNTEDEPKHAVCPYICEAERDTMIEQAAWTGYIYRLWHYMTGDRSVEIIEKQPVEKMFLNYWGGHCEDPEGWTEEEPALEEERHIDKKTNGKNDKQARAAADDRTEAVKNLITLYHGAKTKITGAIQTISPCARRNPKTDFGRGFYTTDDPAFARLTSCGVKGAEPYLYRFEFDETTLKTFVFEPSISWLMFVGANRREFDPDVNNSFKEFFLDVLHGYDLIVGPIANDRSFRMINQFFAPEPSGYRTTCDIALLCLIGIGSPRQYTAITDLACQAMANSIVEITDLRQETQTIITDRKKRYDEANLKTDEIQQNLIDMRLTGYRNPYQTTFQDILKLLESGRDVHDIPGWESINVTRIYRQIDDYLAEAEQKSDGKPLGGWENGR